MQITDAALEDHDNYLECEVHSLHSEQVKQKKISNNKDLTST